MTNQSYQSNAITLSHPFYLSQTDLEGIKALYGAGSMMAMKILEQTKKENIMTKPSEYLAWENALDKTNSFLRDVDFRSKLAAKTHPTFIMLYAFTRQEILSLDTLREITKELFHLTSDTINCLITNEISENEKQLLHVRMCNLSNRQQYHASHIRAFEEILEKEAKLIM